PRDGAIVGAVRDGRVERGVLEHAGPTRRHLLGLILEDPLHLGDLLAGRPAGGEGRDGGLEQAARLEQLTHRLTVRQYHEGEGLDQRLDRDVADERALPRADLDETVAPASADGLA